MLGLMTICFGLLMILPQQTRKGLPCWLGLLILIIKGDIGLLPEGKEGDVLNTGNPLGYLLVLPCPVIK